MKVLTGTEAAMAVDQKERMVEAKKAYDCGTISLESLVKIASESVFILDGFVYFYDFVTQNTLALDIKADTVIDTFIPTGGIGNG